MSYLLVVFLFFLFFFCNHAFIVFRYKKPHAALPMERTKPINQKQITKETHGTNLNIHYRAGFSCAAPSATYSQESTNSQFSRLERKAYISQRKETQLPFTSANEKTRKTGEGTLGGERDNGGEEGGEWGVGTSWGEIPWR